MVLQGKQQGARKKYPVSPEQYGGVDKQHDPGAVLDTNFTNLINVRIYGSSIISRGGQTKVNTVAISGTSGCDGIWDAGDIGAADPSDA